MLDRPTIMRIALEAQVDPRTAKRAIDEGIDAIHSHQARARLREALTKLGHAALIK
jgi:hypothetical protein